MYGSAQGCSGVHTGVQECSCALLCTPVHSCTLMHAPYTPAHSCTIVYIVILNGVGRGPPHFKCDDVLKMASGEESPPHSKYYDVLKMGSGEEPPPHSKYYDVLKMGSGEELPPHSKYYDVL